MNKGKYVFNMNEYSRFIFSIAAIEKIDSIRAWLD